MPDTDSAKRPRPGGSRWRRLARRVGPGRALASLLLVLLLAVRVWDPAPVEAVRLRTFDAFGALRPRQPLPERPVVIVDIDEASLREIGQWPWSRTRVADLVNRLREAGAAAIGFDIVFAEPDRLSPDRVADTLPGLDANVRDALRALPSSDAALADAIRSARVVLGQTALADRTKAGGEPLPPAGIAILGPDPTRFLIRYPGLLRNVPALEEAAAGRGVFTIRPDRDGIVRRVPVVLGVGEAVLPTLTLDILRVLTGAGAILVRTDEAGISSVSLPDLPVPTDPNGQVWIHFGPHDPDRFVPARAVLDGTVPPGTFQDRIVLVGTSAIGLLDTKTTPLDPAMPGVEVHAQLLENMLTGTSLVVPNAAIGIELAVAVAVSFALILFAPILGAFNLLLFGAAVAAALAGASWWRFAHGGVLLDATFPLGASFAVYLTLVFTNYAREQVGRTRIRAAFGQYLSPALVEQLAASPERLRLGGEERTLTVMFSDVRGFTALAETYKHDPQGLTALMNRFLTPLTNAILRRGGTVDKYMGDAVMAFWNAPLDDPDHAAHAAGAAIDMLDAIAVVNRARQAEAAAAGQPFLPIRLGIGLNTGRCTVGNMGSELRFDYSVLGDTVNLASRIEGRSGDYGIGVILGNETASAVRDRFAVLEVDRIRVKGKTEPETVWTLVGGPAVRDDPAFVALAAEHGALLAAYRGRDWEEAARLSARCRALAPPFALGDLYDLYAARIAAFRADPLPPDWDGVHVAAAK